MTRCLTARVIMHRQNILVALKHVGACKSNYTASTADSRLVSVKHFVREGTSQNHHVNTSVIFIPSSLELFVLIALPWKVKPSYWMLGA